MRAVSGSHGPLIRGNDAGGFQGQEALLRTARHRQPPLTTYGLRQLHQARRDPHLLRPVPRAPTTTTKVALQLPGVPQHDDRDLLMSAPDHPHPAPLAHGGDRPRGRTLAAALSGPADAVAEDGPYPTPVGFRAPSRSTPTTPTSSSPKGPPSPRPRSSTSSRSSRTIGGEERREDTNADIKFALQAEVLFGKDSAKLSPRRTPASPRSPRRSRTRTPRRSASSASPTTSVPPSTATCCPSSAPTPYTACCRSS